MNTFARIVPLVKYDKVSYYSVSLNNNKKNLFEEFIKSQECKNKNKLHHILKWIMEIGKNYGAQKRFFRNEAYTSDTSALPPKGKNSKLCYAENGKSKNNSLRLYCLRANENVVFLFSGAIKTTKRVQDCPNVKSHFLLANRLTKAIDKAFRDHEITWNDDATSLNFNKDFKLYYQS